jgi:hypothetical protein
VDGVRLGHVDGVRLGHGHWDGVRHGHLDRLDHRHREVPDHLVMRDGFELMATTAMMAAGVVVRLVAPLVAPSAVLLRRVCQRQAAQCSQCNDAGLKTDGGPP